MFGGKFEYFFDTDFPNIGLPAAPAMGATDPLTAPKNTPGMNIQDAFITWKALGDMVKIDAGYMLPPMSHNAIQGATTLYALDYFANTFLHSAAGSFAGVRLEREPGRPRHGRSAARSLFDGHLEYRAGLFQGLRNAQTAHRGRVAATSSAPPAASSSTCSTRRRASSTRARYLGAKKILSIGASCDFQDSYKYYAGDVFADLPLGPGVFTAQVNFAHWDGGNFIPPSRSETRSWARSAIKFGAVHSARSSASSSSVATPRAPTRPRYRRRFGLLALRAQREPEAVLHASTRSRTPHAVNQVTLQWQLYFF